MIGPRMTLADLRLARALYGGTIVRDVSSETYRLVGALIAGSRVTLGPVAVSHA